MVRFSIQIIWNQWILLLHLNVRLNAGLLSPTLPSCGFHHWSFPFTFILLFYSDWVESKATFVLIGQAGTFKLQWMVSQWRLVKLKRHITGLCQCSWKERKLQYVLMRGSDVEACVFVKVCIVSEHKTLYRVWGWFCIRELAMGICRM